MVGLHRFMAVRVYHIICIAWGFAAKHQQCADGLQRGIFFDAENCRWWHWHHFGASPKPKRNHQPNPKPLVNYEAVPLQF